MTFRRPAVIAALLLLTAVPLAGCATVAADHQQSCAGQAWIATQLFMGRNIPTGGVVTDQNWRDFIETAVASRFPDGFSVIDGTGFWRDSVSSQTIREQSKVLMIFHPGRASDNQAVQEISDAYIERSDQQAVMRADRPACIEFYESDAENGS